MIALAALFNLVLVAVSGYALIRGERPERLGALVNIVGCLGSAAFRLSGLAGWGEGSPTVAIDVAVALSFFWLGCASTRFWPVWSFGFVLAVVVIDVAKFARPDVSLLAFASGQIAYVYLALAALALGTRFETTSGHPSFRRPS